MLVFIIIFVSVFFIAFICYVLKDDSPVQPEELKYFGIKDSEYTVSVWPKHKGVGECLEFNIAGVTYRKGIDKYLGEFEGRLIEEPRNPYDANAIKIVAADGHHVGYVPKDMTSAVRRSRILPCKCFCFIGKRQEYDGIHYFTDCYINI